MKTLKYTAIMLAISLSACGPKSNQTADNAANSAGNVADDVSNTAGNAMMDIKEAITSTPSAQQFVDQAAQSDAFEIAAAKLAIDNAASTDVKNFARKMVAAHTESTAKVKAAAKKAEPVVTPDPTLTDGQNKDLADLKTKHGAEFDKAYISGQVSAHEKALELMQSYAKDGDTVSLKSAAGEIAPIVQKHLDMARALNK